MPAGDGDAEAAAEVGEASLLRAGLDSKVQSCDGAAGESPLHPSFVSCSAQKGTGCWSHWSCWSSTFYSCSSRLFVV